MEPSHVGPGEMQKCNVDNSIIQDSNILKMQKWLSFLAGAFYLSPKRLHTMQANQLRSLIMLE